MTHLVFLDNEAVRALASPAHRKHRQALAYAQVIASRKRRAADIQAVVPATVRVEAGWDRTSPAWAFPNRLRITDSPLDRAAASTAAAIRAQTRVSVADAHHGGQSSALRKPHASPSSSATPPTCAALPGDKAVTIAAI